MPADGDRFDRRNMLKYLGVAGAAGLAGCTEGGSGNDTTTGGEGGQETTTTSGGDETTEAQGERAVGGTYVSAGATDAQTLNWIQVADEESDSRIGLTLDGAYTIRPGNEIFPLWLDVSTDDKRVYSVELRDDLRFSEPYGQMTAEDWVYLIKNVHQGEDNWAGSTQASRWMRNDEPIPVEKTGKLTFDIELPEVDPAFPLKPVLWGQYTAPKALLEKYVDGQDTEGLKTDEELNSLSYTGNLGPYTIENWKRESEFVAVRNEDYYLREADDVPEEFADSPYFDGYTIKVIPEESTRLSAFQSGELTQVGVPDSKVSQFEKMDSAYVNRVPQPFNSLLIYNQRANGWKPFRKQAVRQALSYAVDKRSIVDNIMRGNGSVAHTFQPKFSKWYDNSEVEETGVGDGYSPETARSKLAEALSDTDYAYDGDTLVDGDGEAVSLKIAWATGGSTTQTTVQYFQQAYKQIGIDVTLEGVQFNTLLNKYVANSPPEGEEPEWTAGPYNGGPRDVSTSQKSWDMMYGIVFNTYPYTPTSTEAFWTTKSSTNMMGYEPEVDMSSLYETASTATDEAARKRALAKIFGALSAEQPCNFIAMSTDIIAYQNRVKGPIEEFENGWDYQSWYFAQQN